jgi:hypothetical protein
MVREKRKRKRVSRHRGAGVLTSLAKAVGATSVGKHILNTAADVGGAVLNKAVDLLPVELHIPGYQYCGPGTNLHKRVKRGDPGINPLDSACKEHDIAYNRYSDNSNRAKADSELAGKAWERVKASDSSLAEKAAAWTVTNLMKAKARFGGGCSRRKRKRKNASAALKKLKALVGRGLYLRPYPTGSGHGKKKKKRRQRRTRSRT